LNLKTQVTTAILKNPALAIPWVRRYRGSRSAYVTMDRTLDVFRKTTTVYQAQLEAAGIAPHWIAGKHVLDVGSGAHLGSVFVVPRSGSGIHDRRGSFS
jgi:hypothetical protein